MDDTPADLDGVQFEDGRFVLVLRTSNGEVRLSLDRATGGRLLAELRRIEARKTGLD